jgi:hypothetical protein
LQHILEKWESLFFDVRQSREAVGWIQAHVIRPEQARGNGHLASRLKAAVAGGAVVARSILDLESRLPVTDGEKLFDRKLALHLKFDEAVALPLNTDREKMFFMKLYVDLQLRESRLDHAERQLERRCAEARAKLELAKMRQESARQRSAANDRLRHERETEQARREAQREYLAAQRQARHDADRRAAAARAAASPLARLGWGATVGAAPERSGELPVAGRATSAARGRVAMTRGDTANRTAEGGAVQNWKDCA